jgi:hypothetical protein
MKIRGREERERRRERGGEEGEGRYNLRSVLSSLAWSYREEVRRYGKGLVLGVDLGGAG